MLGKQWQARQLFSRGVALAGEGLLEEAVDAYRQCLELAPEHQFAWFNLGLVHKSLRNWPECLRCNRMAAQLDPGEQAAWWNMGTAATALHDWEAARAAWRGFGLQIPEGVGPIEADYGWTPVRINPEGNAEVVWCRRVDPVRAIIGSIPLPGSGHRWGDYVLHDGEPKGERIVGDHRYLVFNELERWQASKIPTLKIEIVAPSADDARALVERFEGTGLEAEDWTGSVRHLCKACSEGVPHEHAEPAQGEWQAERVFGLAANPDQAEVALEQWAEERKGRGYSGLEVVN